MTELLDARLTQAKEAGLADIMVETANGYMTRLGHIITIFVRNGEDEPLALTFESLSVDVPQKFTDFERQHGSDAADMAKAIWLEALHA